MLGKRLGPISDEAGLVEISPSLKNHTGITYMVNCTEYVLACPSIVTVPMLFVVGVAVATEEDSWA